MNEKTLRKAMKGLTLKLKTGEFKATVTRKCIMEQGKRVVLKDTGHGYFLVLYVLNGQRWISTNPMSIFLRAEDFERVPEKSSTKTATPSAAAMAAILTTVSPNILL